MTKNTPEQAGLYLFHGTGHPLGLQTHDVYDRTRAFEPGMVFTNEPGVYVRKDDILASDVFRKLPAVRAGVDARRRAALRRHRRPDRRRRADHGGEPKMLSAGAPRTVRRSRRGWPDDETLNPNPPSDTQIVAQHYNAYRLSTE